jgi:hypothetical protein
MTGLWASWPISGIRSAIRRSATSCNATDWHGTGAQAHDYMGGLHSHSPGAVGGDRLFHDGGADAAPLATYVLFFIHLEIRRVDIAGVTIHPDEPWMKQIARNVTMEGCGVLRDCCYLLHNRDSKYTQSFRGAIIASGRVEPLALPARSPNLNSYAERCPVGEGGVLVPR